MKATTACFILFVIGIFFPLVGNARGDTLACATFDVDAYNYMGTDAYGFPNDYRNGLTVGHDNSGGLLQNPDTGKYYVHIPFAVIQFDSLEGIETRANGGPNKYLTLTTTIFKDYSDPYVIGVSVAMADIDSNTDGYPIPIGQNPPFFPGNPTGESIDRLQWYFDNIKGDDDAYGGYAGGAIHVGILDVPEPGTYSLDVTTAVDGWIDGSIENYGFGLWGVSLPWPYSYYPGPGDQIEFASIEHGTIPGPTLESLPVGGVLPGDFDADGDVDGNDFLAWQTGFGIQVGALPADGDANGDGRVDRDDYLVWEGNFGLSTESGTSAAGTGFSGGGISQIPEPSAAGLILILAAGSLGFVFRRF
ncbi:MAG: hypothetical protein JW829_12090 [Pirellulales bacterium]|nr:hypothetical protein [Pirellulales bacterium]